MYHIIFRTCDAVQSLHNTPRPFDLDKRTLIKVCFLSLHQALRKLSDSGVSYRIIVLGDTLSDEMIEFFRGFEVDLRLGTFGNDESIRQTLTIARTIALESASESVSYTTTANDWIYFCEDDYLHTADAFTVIHDLVANHASYITDKPFAYHLRIFRTRLDDMPLVIHPTDYPDRYKPKYLRFSLIFLAAEAHWRQITDTTFTMLLSAPTLLRFWKTLWKSATGANDRFLSRNLYAGLLFAGNPFAGRRFAALLFAGLPKRRKALCLSPIPGVATHMHEGVMSPHVEWKKRVEELREELDRHSVNTAPIQRD